ncbi:elicitor-responsive protein 1-like isoform X2 [Zingiber officinale]|uniref:elicitor-responsive protein 1-like isoform X2 n=1 Tax=Zingiber officinale TaxID=94328 RepID=UPI001C4D5ABD|nr:elicitor-responsive protein 1-like isoform X2 [Zingiber officinale]
MSFGELEVLLVDAKGLKDTDLIGKMDPYAEIQYRDQQQKSKVAYKEGGNPRWNQKFKFKVVLRVMDRDTFSADDFVGEATINVGDVIAMGMEKGFMEVNPCKYRVVLSDKRYHGEIRVGVTFKLINLTKM